MSTVVDKSKVVAIVGMNDERDVILYPAGGAFNKLRSKQTYLDVLLEKTWIEYSTVATQKKRENIRTNIVDPMRASGRVLKIFHGRNPDRGCLIDPCEDEVMERISQKLRDTKKRKLSLRNAHRKTPKPSDVGETSGSKDDGDDLTETLNFDFDEALDQDMPEETSVCALQHVIENQWSALGDLQRLCASQKESIEKLTLVNSFQHDLLVARGISES